MLTGLREFLTGRGIDALLVAVSGGADSLALLHTLAQLREELSLTLIAATLDHGLRGQAGADDVEYTRALADAWGVPCVIGQVDVAALARKWGMGSEAAARRARYDWLAGIARKHNLHSIATAHHADDQVETILMHIVRGAGIGGLRGMDAIMLLPDHPRIRLVRPLLSVTRAQIDAYCAEQGIIPRHDATNDDTRYTRNRLRHEVLPLLRQINPQVDAALLRLSAIATVDDAALERLLHQVIRPAGDQVRREQGRYRIARAWFAHLDLALQRRVFPWVNVMLEREPPAFERIEAAITAAQQGVVGTVIELGQGLSLSVDYHDLIIARADAPPLNINWGVLGEIVVTPPCAVVLGDQRLIIARDPLQPTHARLIIAPDARVTIRQRQRGDRFAPLGMGGHTQKVAEWMVNHKVPAALRDHVPLLIVNDAIAAICWGDQWAISEHVRVPEGTAPIFHAQFMKNF